MKIAFTGSRPKDLGGWNLDWSAAPGDIAAAVKQALHELGWGGMKPLTFISGGAQGIDLLAFDAVEILKAEGYPATNVMYIPFKGWGRNWKAWGTFSRGALYARAKAADDIVVLRPEPPVDRPSTLAALFGRNAAMVKDAEAVIGVAKAARLATRKGGTAHTLNLAGKAGIPTFTFEPTLVDGILRVLERNDA